MTMNNKLNYYRSQPYIDIDPLIKFEKIGKYKISWKWELYIEPNQLELSTYYDVFQIHLIRINEENKGKKERTASIRLDKDFNTSVYHKSLDVIFETKTPNESLILNFLNISDRSLIALRQTHFNMECLEDN